MLDEYLLKLSGFKEIIVRDQLKISGSNFSSNIMLLALDFYANDKSLFVVLPDLYEAQKYYDELINIIDENDVLFYPADELLTVEMISSTGDFKYERIHTIVELINSNKKKIVVTHTNGAIKYQFSKQKWADSIFSINKNDTFDMNALAKKLIALGYEPTFQTIKTGQFSKRGSIIDIFPLGVNEPVRIDFFDDQVDTIKTYDIDTQRSIKEVDSVFIYPVTEMIYYDSEVELATSKLNSFMASKNLSDIEEEKYNKDIIAIKEHNNIDMLIRYIRFFDNNPITIFDFVENKTIYSIDYPKIKEIYDKVFLDLSEYCKGQNGYSLLDLNYYSDTKFLMDYKIIEGLRSIGEVDVKLKTKEIAPMGGNIRAIMDYFNKNIGVCSIICFIKNENLLKNLVEELFEYHLPYSYSDIKNTQINIIKNGYYPSYEDTLDNVIFINEQTLFSSIAKPKKKVRYKSIYQGATKISRYDELKIGDYVVHYDYGIGKYLGIKTMEVDGLKRDYLQVMYNKNDSLYIPIEQVKDIMKYASGDVENVSLSTIGGTEWAKTKAKVKKRVHDISDKLIALYAKRMESSGYAFMPDGEMQHQFEAGFPYELTADQRVAIDDIKRDMESKKPMDRLVCGDVGYGKTEVALRAAFKAAYEGKQVAVLAPTTILSRQHYYTFKERMESFGIRVELLNRFVSVKNQNQIIKDLADGNIDVIVGTHKILSNDIKFKDLGLLIIDEEQRFGVTHKERIKELKVNVDTITLSATPIPRTLQMSIVGIKDLSMIETPPKNRYPIQTYVLERNDTIIKDAIERELARGGQVFYLYNYVDSIEDVRDHLKSLVPNARICIGHGKLKKDALEDVICSFIDKEYDILLCTTIIETGIDMPDTNTLIIHDADHLGLSQLYQIRGRVGRSNKIAYAYLMYEPTHILTPQAEKRLETIKEFNELGSGFKIAMRDLSIRGAGDLLGEEQSGFVESVGIDVYMKILEEEIENKKLGTKAIDDTIPKPVRKPLASRSISKDYISSEDVRIEIHKKIDSLTSLAELHSLERELIDRFGKFDLELATYMHEKLMQNYFDKLHIYKSTFQNKYIFIMYMDKDYVKNIDGVKIFKAAFDVSKDIVLNYQNQEIVISIDTSKYKTKRDYFIILNKFFNEITKNA